jgi:hypothetical protein
MNFVFFIIFALINGVFYQQEYERFEKSFDTSFIQVGEELVYEVKYLFFKLGQLKFKVIDKFTNNGKQFYKVRIDIDSYSVPFVDIHAKFEAVFDSRFIAHSYWSEQREKKYYQSVKYRLIENLPGYVVEKNYHNLEYNTRGNKIDTVKITTLYCDGPSLFYYARSNAHIKKTVLLPTFIEGIKGITLINFGKKKTQVKIDAFDSPIEAYEIDGKANYIGFFGLTGDFTGWISSDEMAIPLKGKLKLFIGNIIVELKSWKKEQNLINLK